MLHQTVIPEQHITCCHVALDIVSEKAPNPSESITCLATVYHYFSAQLLTLAHLHKNRPYHVNNSINFRQIVAFSGGLVSRKIFYNFRGGRNHSTPVCWIASD